MSISGWSANGYKTLNFKEKLQIHFRIGHYSYQAFSGISLFRIYLNKLLSLPSFK